MTIEPFGAADEPRWRELFAAYNAFYGAHLEPEIYATTWQRLSDPVAPSYGFAARDGERIVGFAHYLFHGSTWSIEPVCYLEDLFVDPAMRGHGYGAALIAAVASAARAQGSTRLYWLTQESNAVARRLYDRVASLSGFIRYDVALG